MNFFKGITFKDILLIVGSISFSFAIVLGYVIRREDKLMLKYSACIMDHNKLAMRASNEQAAFLKAEMKSVSKLLACRENLLDCLDSKSKKRKRRRKR